MTLVQSENKLDEAMESVWKWFMENWQHSQVKFRIKLWTFLWVVHFVCYSI